MKSFFVLTIFFHKEMISLREIAFYVTIDRVVPFYTLNS